MSWEVTSFALFSKLNIVIICINLVWIIRYFVELLFLRHIDSINYVKINLPIFSCIVKNGPMSVAFTYLNDSINSSKFVLSRIERQKAINKKFDKKSDRDYRRWIISYHVMVVFCNLGSALCCILYTNNTSSDVSQDFETLH